MPKLPAASLIWHAPDGDYFEKGQDRYRCFRRPFDLTTLPEEAWLELDCAGHYLLYINGRPILRGPGRYDRRWPRYDQVPVGPFLQQGHNCIALLCLHHGYGTGQRMAMDPGLWVCLHTGDPGHPLLVSDEQWKSREADWFLPAQRINGRQGPIEIQDLNRYPHGWTDVDYDDSAWSQARVIRRQLSRSPFWNSEPRDIPLLAEKRLLAHHAIAQGGIPASPTGPEAPPGWPATAMLLRQARLAPTAPRPLPLTLAAGEEAHLELIAFDPLEAGYLQLHLHSEDGGCLDCIYLEALPPGTEEGYRLDALITEVNRPMDRFHFPPGEQRLEVAFGWKGFRYLLLLLHPGSTVHLLEAGIRTRRYPAPRRGLFITSDPRLNALFELCAHTAMLCAQDGLIDSPSREQQQWIGDGRWTGLVHFQLTGDDRLYRRLLEQIGQSQDASGMIKPRHPDDHNNIPPIPAYGFAWVCALYEYLLHTGDAALPRRWWPNLVELLRWFEPYETAGGLLQAVPGWSFIDWGLPSQGPAAESRPSAPLNLLYLEALRFAHRLAAHLGEKGHRRHWRRKAKGLRRAIAETFWSAPHQAYLDTPAREGEEPAISEVTNALALLHLHGDGPHPPRRRRRSREARALIGHLFEPAAATEEGFTSRIIPASPFYMIRVLQALALHGRTDLALKLLLARYDRFLKADSTTTWEKWSLFRTDPQGRLHQDSASHGWGSSPILFLFAEVLGVRPKAPGFARSSVEPQATPLLDHCYGWLPLPSGPLEIALGRGVRRIVRHSQESC